MDPDEMIYAESNTSHDWEDWFIRIPPGSVLELPTGQVGDEGMFDMSHPDFQFTPGAEPYGLDDFLNYDEDSNSWRYDSLGPDGKDLLVIPCWARLR